MSNFISYPFYSTAVDQNHIISRNLKIENSALVQHLIHTDNVTNAGGAKSLHKITDNAAYKVSVGKTAKLILILKSNSDDAQFKVWESDSVDSATGDEIYTWASNDFNDGRFMTVCPDWDLVHKTFAAEKYINIEVTSSPHSVTVVSAVVVES